MSLLVEADASRKKALGQYFSGRGVGRLLAALAQAHSARRIIDPMVGSGDLLASCLEVGASPASLVGVDLDPKAVNQAERALSGAPGLSLSVGNAFGTSYPEPQFDLVITNPPYIRYQSQGLVEGLEIPLAAEVRTGLLAVIQSRSDMTSADRKTFARAAESYPGTADLAVPAWILCASLVAEGGALAVVAPQAWLTRNYAQPVRELLDDVFELEYLVEDGDASWFDDALVRTQLVVARRRRSRGAKSVVIARATRSLGSSGSFTGDLPDEKAVAERLRDVSDSTPQAITRGLTAHRERATWLASRGVTGHVPSRVRSAIGDLDLQSSLRTLASYGWQAGQGLRTGANDFFYVEAADGGARPAARWGDDVLPFPDECLLPVVRRQADLGETCEVADSSTLPFRTLYLKGWVTASDARVSDVAEAPLPSSVSRWISRVAASRLNDREGAKLFPELAAVATNVRRDRAGRQTGFWYQLPSLAPRHRPAILMARVCGAAPTAYFNTAGAVVDANFSTLWPTDPDALESSALLALLQSAWVRANLEVSCTVLGGGALKVEAADLRRLPLPELEPAQIHSLALLGEQLKRDGRTLATLRAINLVIIEALGGSQSEVAARALERLAHELLVHRTSR